MTKFRYVSLLVFLTLLFFALPAQAQETYSVRPGDSLFLIGQRFGTTPAELQSLNNLSSTLIYPGQVLRVANTSSSTYRVVPGDTLFLISQRFNVPLDRLRAANNIWGSLIYPGQVITIPGQASPTASRSLRFSRSEIQMMAQIVHGEARGEPYVGQVAVASVILNRVRHPSFPNTVSGVIFQPGEFCAVRDGQYYLTPGQTAYRAVEDAINGWDPTGGALYYWNPRTATSSWVWSRPIVETIGNHIFAR